MKVENTAFMMEKLASDCSPLQYIRELTKNSIEAIQARQKTGWSGNGRIIWDADWLYVEQTGVFKLQVSDNGTGMTGPQMEDYINSLSSSGRVQSMTENFGMGAKITAGVENPVGLIYKSWVAGKGEMCQLWKDPQQLVYGLKQFPLPNGDYAHHVPLSDITKPRGIDDYGTAVVLLGKEEKQHTMKPDGMPLKWLIKYLNTRFFVLPENITIKVRDFSRSEPSGWPHSPDVGMGDGGSQERTIVGMDAHLSEKAVAKGVRQLNDANIYWYILPEERIQQADIWECTAHVGALFQDELYEMKTGRNSYARIREFGMVFGSDRVVIYAQPNERLDVAANIARSGLLIHGEELPWAKWAAEFRSDLPEELRQLMDSIVSSSETVDHRDAIKRRLREIKDLMRISRYRRNVNGNLRVDGALPGGGDSRPDGSTRNPNESSNSGGGGSSSDIYGAFISADGESAIESASKSNEPRVVWVSVNDTPPSRSHGDDFEDRAGIYLKDQNMIQANADFRVFEDMIHSVAARYEDSSEIAHQVTDTVREWFEQQLTEAVIGVLALQGSPHWSTQTIDAALSAEALTTSVMPRYNTYRMITRSLGARLGAAASLPQNEN
jgi:hypothetical protein